MQEIRFGKEEQGQEKEQYLTTPETEEEIFSLEDKETEASAPQEEIKSKGVFKLSKPIMVDGENLHQIRYDFEKIQPIQYMNIVKAVGKKEFLINPALNMSVQINLFCKASGVPASILGTQLSLPDVNAICTLAQDFLLSTREQEESDLL